MSTDNADLCKTDSTAAFDEMSLLQLQLIVRYIMQLFVSLIVFPFSFFVSKIVWLNRSENRISTFRYSYIFNAFSMSIYKRPAAGCKLCSYECAVWYVCVCVTRTILHTIHHVALFRAISSHRVYVMYSFENVLPENLRDKSISFRV